MLKIAFGKETMSRTKTFEWYSRFKKKVKCLCSLILVLIAPPTISRNAGKNVELNRSSTGCSGNCCRNKHATWFVSHNFTGRPRYEVSFG